MTESLDECRTEFSPQQAGRMRCWASAVLQGWILVNPVIGNLDIYPDPVPRGELLSLRARNATDPDGTVAEVRFYRDADGDGLLNPYIDDDLGAGQYDGTNWILSRPVNWPAGAHTYFARAKDSEGAWSQAIATTGVVQGNQPLILTNPRVVPDRGDVSTMFEFLVDYYDPERHAPSIRQVHVAGLILNMSLKSGSPGSGTFHCIANLPPGSHHYFFYFADAYGNAIVTRSYDGPEVCSGDKAILDIHIQCARISTDLFLEYSTQGNTGPWISIPITGIRLEPIEVPAASPVWLRAGVTGPNHQFLEWQVWDNGTLVDYGTTSLWTVDIGAACSVVPVEVFYYYRPQAFTISGTVLRQNGTPVPEGVDLLLTSDEQTLSLHSTDGTWQFTGVRGGVAVTVAVLSTGYDFVPPKRVYPNLKDSYPDQVFTAYFFDDVVPTAQFVDLPASVVQDPAVYFSWQGSDDKTASANLLYQYKLEPVDAEWGSETSSTSATYNLQNGVYTFKVRPKDEAGNINEAPISHTFVVNALPRVVSAVRTSRSVWASRVTLETPAGATPSATFVLLPEHSGVANEALVPVQILRAGNANASGANTIVAGQLGLPATITAAARGWAVTLPESIPAGRTRQYDLIWGKTAYFGWQELVSVPNNLPSGGYCWDTLLDGDLNLWRLMDRDIYVGTHRTWMNVSAANSQVSVLDETTLQSQVGQAFDGSYGWYPDFSMGSLVTSNGRVYALWNEEKHEQFPSTFPQWYRFALATLEGNGQPISLMNSDYEKRNYITIPSETIGNNLWLVGTTRSAVSAGPHYAWFTVRDFDGNEIVPKTTIDTITDPRGSGFGGLRAARLGNRVVILWERYWELEDGSRREICYQVREPNGVLVRPTTKLVNVLPDNTVPPYTDEYSCWFWAVTDRSGKLWLPFQHQTDGQIRYYYAVLTPPNGDLYKPFVETSGVYREFRFCDRDGVIWATEGNELLLRRDNDSPATQPRQSTWFPSQEVGNVTAAVGFNGYRIFDRWSPQPVVIDVPLGQNPASMEVIDLNLWGNNLHTADLTMALAGSIVWTHPGSFTGRETVNMTGVLSEGHNLITLTQTDLLGGQVLLTFPYQLQDGCCLPDRSCVGVQNAESCSALGGHYWGAGQACDSDPDGDGVLGCEDSCPNTVPGSPVTLDGCPPVIPGDFDRDGDVDAADLSAFEACASGPGIAQNNPNCVWAMLDGDSDVDQTDFSVFQRCISGENEPGRPGCESSPPRIGDATVTGELVEGQSCVLQVGCTAVDDDGTVQSVVVDLSSIGGTSTQALTKGVSDQWSWSGTVMPPSRGSKAVTFVATDDKGAVSRVERAIEVVAPNAPPNVIAPVIQGNLVKNHASLVAVSCTAVDGDGSVQSVVVDLSTIGGSATQALAAGGDDLWSWSGTVTPPNAGLQTCTFSATDDDGASSTAQGSAMVAYAAPDMVLVPAGEFQMGDTFNEGETDELPVHAVYVDVFYMDRYEVTNEQYAEALNWARSQGNLITIIDDLVYKVDSGTTYPYCDLANSTFSSLIRWNTGAQVFEAVPGKEQHPMVEVTWYGAVAYANWRSSMLGLQPCYDLSTWDCDFSKSGYRLPTEAEWEYAGRGGRYNPYTRYPWGDTIDGSNANYWQSGDPFETAQYPRSTPVGYYNGDQIPAGADMANGYGLYDLAGNVWEWCNDWYSPTYYQWCVANCVNPCPNPTGPVTAQTDRVLRGQSWYNLPSALRCANRDYATPSDRFGDGCAGFRLARSSEPPPNSPPSISSAVIEGVLLKNQVCEVTTSCTAADVDGTVQSVVVDLSTIGGSATQALAAGGDDLWSWSGTVSPPNDGVQTCIFIASDNRNARATAQVSTTVSDAAPDMVLVPAGEFQMGDTFNEGETDERSVHAVYVDAFHMDRYEVTNEQYAEALNWVRSQGNHITIIDDLVYQADSGTTYPYCDLANSTFSSLVRWNTTTQVFEAVPGKEQHPMVEVTWYGAVAYANWRSTMLGLQPCYDLSTWDCDFSKSGYRLPTEAEWEFAARGGVAGHRFPWADSDEIQHARANYYSSSSFPYDTSPTQGYHPEFYNPPPPYTSPVGYFAPNGYGLYDMAGNVSEWCNDWYSSSYYQWCVANCVSPCPNPTGPVTAQTVRVLRGQSWYYWPSGLRCANRDYATPNDRVGDGCSGFRLVRTQD